MSTTMTREEREAFLAGLHVGVISIAEEGRGPLAVPIWYAYDAGGEVRIITGLGSRKGQLLERVERLSLCAQTEAPPYKYVSVEGPIVSTLPSDPENDLRPMARRYLGEERGDAYVAATAGDREEAASIVVRMRPERWLTVDYGKR